MVATKKTTNPPAKAPSRAGEKLEVRHPEFGRLVNEKLTKGGLSNARYGNQIGVGAEMVRRYREGFSMAEGEKLKKLSALTGIPVETLLMADKGGRKKNGDGEQKRRLSLDEQTLLDEYRQLPEDVQKMARVRIIELLEEFGPASKKNPFGRGGTQ